MPGYCITYDIVAPDEADGDVTERGFVSLHGTDYPIPDELCGDEFQAWRDEMGFDVKVTADDWIDNPDDPIAPERAMADVIISRAAFQTSGVPWSPGDWYSTDSEQDMHTGCYRTESVHLHGWTPEQETTIYRLVKSGRAST